MFKNSFLYWIDRFYSLFISAGSKLPSLFLLWLRLTWGHQFVITGLYKLHHIPETIQFFNSLNIPYSYFHAHLVGLIEVIGGAFLFVGFCSRIAGLACAIIMIGALTIAHSSVLTHFRFITDPAALVGQAPFPYLITSLMIFIFGPGRIAVDAWIKRWADRQPKY